MVSEYTEDDLVGERRISTASVFCDVFVFRAGARELVNELRLA